MYKLHFYYRTSSVWKFDVRPQWRHSLFQKYQRPSLNNSLECTGSWINVNNNSRLMCVHRDLWLSSSTNIEIKWNLWGISSNYSFITCFDKVNLLFVESTDMNKRPSTAHLTLSHVPNQDKFTFNGMGFCNS